MAGALGQRIPGVRGDLAGQEAVDGKLDLIQQRFGVQVAQILVPIVDPVKKRRRGNGVKS